MIAKCCLCYLSLLHSPSILSLMNVTRSFCQDPLFFCLIGKFLSRPLLPFVCFQVYNGDKYCLGKENLCGFVFPCFTECKGFMKVKV
jgi:hypothetical protein